MAGYGTDEGFQAWLTDNGYTLPAGAPSPAVLRERGSAYIDAVYGPRFVGVPAGGVDQERAWPRSGAIVYGALLASTVIPDAVVRASYRAAYAEAVAPGSLSVIVTPSRLVKRQKVEGIEREFFEPGDDPVAAATPILSDIDGLLARFLIEEVDTPIGIWSVG